MPQGGIGEVEKPIFINQLRNLLVAFEYLLMVPWIDRFEYFFF
jgi:hypothetical protein